MEFWRWRYLHRSQSRSFLYLKRELFGEDRLLELLATLDCATMTARNIQDAIVHGAQEFVGNAPKYDDMTVIVIKVL